VPPGQEEDVVLLVEAEDIAAHEKALDVPRDVPLPGLGIDVIRAESGPFSEISTFIEGPG
jgi:hypothetical protein